MKTSFKQTIEAIKNDLPKGNISLKSFITNYFYNPGFRVLFNHRIGKYYFFSSFFLIRHLGLYYKRRLILKRNCDISYKATIGSNVRFPHPLGIVIGDGVVIKNNVKIWQQVTLGSHGKKTQQLTYPIVYDGVKIFAGAKVIGGVSIGAGAVIGANSVVNIDVPENSVAVGIPCEIRIRN